jgi:hypothetical protein
MNDQMTVSELHELLGKIISQFGGDKPLRFKDDDMGTEGIITGLDNEPDSVVLRGE